MSVPSDVTIVYEVHHTVITVVEGVESEAAAEAFARQLLENRPVDPLSITEGAEIFWVGLDRCPRPQPSNGVDGDV